MSTNLCVVPAAHLPFRVVADDSSTLEVIGVLFCLRGKFCLWLPVPTNVKPRKKRTIKYACFGKIEVYVGEEMPKDLSSVFNDGYSPCFLSQPYPGVDLPDNDKWPPKEDWLEWKKLCQAAALPEDSELVSIGNRFNDDVDRPIILHVPSNGIVTKSISEPALAQLDIWLNRVGILQVLFENSIIACEFQVWALNNKINKRGVRLHRQRVRALMRFLEHWILTCTVQAMKASEGELDERKLKNPTFLRSWLESRGVCLPNLQKSTVVAYLQKGKCNKQIRSVLEAHLALLDLNHQLLATSLREMSCDGRLRHKFLYFGCRTGRFTSPGFSLHNLPKPCEKIKNLLGLIHALTDIDKFKSLLPKHLPLGVAIQGLLRSCLIPSKDHLFLILDFTSIEALCLAWIAGENLTLQAFDEGRDIYDDFARVLFESSDDVLDNQRSIAKVVFLACGYGLGTAGLEKLLSKSNINLSNFPLTANQIIHMFRSRFPAITDILWEQFQTAFQDAICSNRRSEVGKCLIEKSNGKDVVVTLPGGRKLTYREVCVDQKGNQFQFTTEDGHIESLYGSKIAQNVVQAICRDLLVTAMFQLDIAGLDIVMHVHDEVVLEVPKDNATELMSQALKIMSVTPDWARALTLQVRGVSSTSYAQSKTPKATLHYARNGKLISEPFPK